MACQETSNRKAATLTESSDIAIIENNELTKGAVGSFFNFQYPTYAVWDDYEFPVNNLRVNPATSKPDYSATDCVYNFAASGTETVTGNGHFPHWWYIGTSVYPHVHWTQRATGDIAWSLTYKIWDNGTVEPDWATADLTGSVFAYSASGTAQISTLATIDCSSITGLSPNVKIKLSRLGDATADTYTLVSEFMKFDFHLQKDANGSDSQFVK